MTMLQKVLTF